jgi:hypothetical protein
MQQFGTNVTAATNTHATIDNTVKQIVSVGSVLYQRKVGDKSSQTFYFYKLTLNLYNVNQIYISYLVIGKVVPMLIYCLLLQD